MFRHLFSITPGAHLKPARGVRAAVAIFLALLLLAAFGHTAFGSAAGLGFLLGVLFTEFCDLGSSQRARVLAMSALTIGGPLVVAAGRSWPALWWMDALAVFVVTLLAGSLLSRSPLMSLVGLLLTIAFVVTLGMGGGAATALPSALGFLLGGAFVLLLVLLSSLPEQVWQHAARPAEPTPTQATGVSPGERVGPGRIAKASRLLKVDIHSLLSSQALLRAAGAGGAAALAWNLGVAYPQWAPIVVITCVRPKKKTSVLAALQNSTGTILGALLADLLINTVQNPSMVALIVVAVVFIAFTVKDLNYALFTFFMTNLTLLLISLSTPGVSHIRLRVFSVLVGAGIALGVTFLSDWLAQRHTTLLKAQQ